MSVCGLSKNMRKTTEQFLRAQLGSAELVQRLSSIILHNINSLEENQQSPPLYTWEVAKELGLSNEVAQALTLCSTLFYSTADYADDFADGDVQDPVAVATNNICLLLFLHEQSILAIPEINDSQKQALIRFFSGLGIQMALGQEMDIQSSHPLQNIDPLQVARKKSGAEAAVFFGAPAVLAGLNPQAWISFGTSFGTLIQILSDYLDLFLNPDCEDWVNGKITLPILKGLEHPRYGQILNALWQGERASPENQAQALWYLCQAKVEEALKETGKKELENMKQASQALQNPSFLTELIRQAKDEIEAVCESLEEFRQEQEKNPPLLDATNLNA